MNRSSSSTGKSSRDVRPQLYDQYVSKFKTGQLHRDERRLRQYWSWCRHKYLPILKELKPTDAILELGCGPGNILEFLAQNGFTNAEGIDIAKEQIALANAMGFNASVADAFAFLKKGRARYQAILAIDFVEHFTKQEVLTLLPLMFRALKPGGLVLLQTPNGQGLFPGQVMYGDLTHSTIFAEDSLRHALKLAGFGEIKFSETGPAPDSVEGVVRSVLWGCIRACIRIVRQIEAKNSSRLWTENMICWAHKQKN